MIDIELAIRLWLKWRDRVDDFEAKRATGMRPYGIEYRIMLEGGIVQRSGSVDLDWELIEYIDQVWKKLYVHFKLEMDAVKIYYSRKKSYRAVRVEMKTSQYMSKCLVQKGITLIQGGLIGVMDKDVD